jgi:hypothetical protein
MKRSQLLTFGDQAENHVGMQKIGELVSLDDLKKAQSLV